MALQSYYAYGKYRLGGTLPTDHWFTGQKYSSGNGLYYYGARYYDPALGRFIQPDTIVPDPGDARAYDRYAYVYNNPLKYNDPSGHILDIVADAVAIGADAYDIYNNGLNWENGIALTADVGGFFIPFVTGAGQCVRHCDELVQYGDDAFNIAKSGGKHAGFYENYVGKPDGQILRGIRSIQAEITEHYGKIADPRRYLPNWDALDPRQQKHLLEIKWPEDIQRQQEQLGILQGILSERGR